MRKHTPIPWAISDVGIGFEIEALVDGKLSIIAQTQQLRPNDRDVNHTERKANAAFIVRAVNSHDALVAALKELLEEHCCDDGSYDGTTRECEVCRPAHAALKAAGEL